MKTSKIKISQDKGRLMKTKFKKKREVAKKKKILKNPKSLKRK